MKVNGNYGISAVDQGTMGNRIHESNTANRTFDGRVFHPNDEICVRECFENQPTIQLCI